MERPKRLYIPISIRRIVRARQQGICGCAKNCGEEIDGRDTEWNHDPPLALRDILPDGSDYAPGQLDPRYIFEEVKEHHRDATAHPRGKHTSIDSHQHAIAKVRRLRGENKPKHKRKIANSGFAKAPPGYNPWTRKIER